MSHDSSDKAGKVGGVTLTSGVPDLTVFCITLHTTRDWNQLVVRPAEQQGITINLELLLEIEDAKYAVRKQIRISDLITFSLILE